MESRERSPLVGDKYHNNGSLAPTTFAQFKIYKRRWYVLFVFTAEALIYNMAWNTWAPIQEPCKIAFGWTDFDLLLLTSWAAISLILTSAPFTWLMDTKGLRISVLLIAFLSVLGKCLQAIPVRDNKVRSILINAGQFITMAGGPVAIGAPPLVSATWFPPGERTTATAIGTLAGYFGIAMAFAVGPAMVHKDVPLPSTVSNLSASEKKEYLAKVMNHQITQYTFFELGLCAAVFVCVLLYFPARPPLPPCLSSSTQSTQSTRTSFRQVMRDGQFWLLIMLAGLVFGVYFGWLSMLDVFLAKFKVDPTTAGWLGCAATLAGVVSGILLARCADIIKHRTKQMLMFLLVLSTISQLIFSLSCAGILPSTKQILFTSIIFGGLVYNGTLPLFFELAMECVYPFGEGIAGSLLVTMGNVVLMLFYIAFMLPHSDVRWMNWVTVTGLGVCVLGLLIYREKYTRLEIDARSNVSNRDLGNTGDSKPLLYPAS
ncbi:solute carrier family 49 member 4 homolog [Porites lutea]|uniref:solute carrier family 49 member 4 homolog n=1 Tax=Porites lutea TaxID=51062 RepID=UPI003CC69633